jgi:riboflavin kinase / FMN adenylyltransferase
MHRSGVGGKLILMQVHFGLGTLVPEWQQSAVVIGTFDGVHLGHQAVIRQAVEIGRQAEIPSIVLTFDRHPAAVLAPGRQPKLLASLESNLEQLDRLGVSMTVVLPFDLALSRTTATDFLSEILEGSLRAKQFVVGHDFALGANREGTAEWLAQRLPTCVVEPFSLNGERVSSSGIRLAVESGSMETAGQWLGRPFRIDGVVVGGQKLGRTIDYPTINLARSIDQVLPPDGVYVATAQMASGKFGAALSIGTRPTVGGEHRTIEAYLLDYPGESLYGQSVGLQIHHWLRGEENFPSLEVLKAQIAQDVLDTREWLADSAHQ